MHRIQRLVIGFAAAGILAVGAAGCQPTVVEDRNPDTTVVTPTPSKPDTVVVPGSPGPPGPPGPSGPAGPAGPSGR